MNIAIKTTYHPADADGPERVTATYTPAGKTTPTQVVVNTDQHAQAVRAMLALLGFNPRDRWFAARLTGRDARSLVWVNADSAHFDSGEALHP